MATENELIAYRERVAEAVGMGVGELTTVRRDDPRAALLRMVAAYLLLESDRLGVGDVARIMDKSESWVRNSKDYIERRVNHYYAFKVYVEKMIAAYDLASIGMAKPARRAVASGIDIDAYRQRIAQAAGMTAIELVALNSDGQDAEMMQRVAAHVLLSRDLPVGEIALVMHKDEQWVRSSRTYIDQRIKRDRNLKVYIEKTIAAYDALAGS